MGKFTDIFIHRQTWVVVVFVSCIILVFWTLYTINTRFPRESWRNPSMELVIAHFNEDVSAIQDLDGLKNIPTTCYRKYTNESGRCDRVVHLPNVGRESHTYLYHIVSNYDRLADLTFFVQGGALGNHFKKDILTRVVQNAMKTRDSAFVGVRSTDQSYREFQIETYSSSTHSNYAVNPGSQQVLSPIRPLGPWLDHYLPGTPLPMLTYGAIFAVSNGLILQHPVSRYQKLLETVNTAPDMETGHYIERVWTAIFHPIPETCLYTV
jgi:Protein of unknown function (DUF3431)